jgi:isoquinoline 1-oxidoreductase beta subunit
VPAPLGGFNPGARAACSKAVREMSAWDRRGPVPKGTGKGVAFQFAHAATCAYVVEVSVDAKKAIKVNRAWCAVDIGRQIVNLSQSESLVHGGFIEGMSHIMNWEITIERGRAVQQNFDEYQPTRMAQVPTDFRSSSCRRTSIRRAR